MTFHSPYNFIPLQPPVLMSGVQAALSSGIPLRDGLCGSLAIELEALTPLLVGGARKTGQGPAQVRPFQFPDGSYGIPGSSLHGLLRSVVESAMGGRMRQVDDRRFALRDFVSTVKQDYLGKMGEAKAGFLRRREDGSREIVPCRHVLFKHGALEPFDIKAKDFGRLDAEQEGNRSSSLARKYDLLNKAFSGLCLDFKESPPDQNKRSFADDIKHGQRGRFVVSAQVNKKKCHDFVFFERRDHAALPVSAAQWRDFLFIHDDDDPKSIRPWPGYWRERHAKGEEVPVFYIEDDAGLRFGLARMFRLAGRTSTHDAIRASHPQLLDDGVIDLSDALFGTLGDAGVGAARGRVACAPMYATGALSPVALGTTVLGSPKASYYPAYLYQTANWKEKWTHWDSQGDDSPRIRGRKRYYAKKEAVLPPPPDKSGDSVQTTLHALPAGTRMQGRLALHNLAPFELGALLWALELGEDPRACHQLGMGKPFGMGSVRLRLRLDECRLRTNVDAATNTTEGLLTAARAAFQSFINARVRDWEKSLPVKALLALSDPAATPHQNLDTSRYPDLAKKEFEKTRDGAGPLPYAIVGDKKPPLASAKAEADARYGTIKASDERQVECMLFFKKSEVRLYAVIDKGDRPLPKELEERLLSTMSSKQKDKAADRKLAVLVEYKVAGNSYTVLDCQIKQGGP